jgi:hypothetical protein
VSIAASEPRGRSRPDACSLLWDQAHASALGTAPAARFWLALEQNGPWGARAATQSHLDPDLGRSLDRMCQDAGGRFILIRRPGSHSDQRDRTRQVQTHRVYLGAGLAALPWLLQADLDDPARLKQLDQLPRAALGSGDINAVQAAMGELQRSPRPVLLICSNSRRDVCCSVRGRPVALESGSQRPGQVWECSHTGGHRFAPTGVLLPHGQTFGRLCAVSAVAALDAAARGELPAELLGAACDRGRSHLGAPEQAAESTVRAQIGELRLHALSTTAAPRADRENAWQCQVTHLDGRSWDVVAVRGPSGDNLPESCGKQAVPTWRWTVVNDSDR